MYHLCPMPIASPEHELPIGTGRRLKRIKSGNQARVVFGRGIDMRSIKEERSLQTEDIPGHSDIFIAPAGKKTLMLDAIVNDRSPLARHPEEAADNPTRVFADRDY